METRTIAALGVALCLAGMAPPALAAASAKAKAKPAPAAAAAKDGPSAAEEAKETATGDATKGVKAAGPHLVMRHHRANPGKDVDLRHCLDLPTAKEVIRCSERK